MNSKSQELVQIMAEYGSGVSSLALIFLGLDPNVTALTNVTAIALFKIGFSDFVSRQMSKREIYRIGSATNYIADGIKVKMDSGLTVRYIDGSDEVSSNQGREILEGVLQKCKEQYEERKIKYTANILVNWAFDESITIEEARWFLKVADRLSFSQFCLISIFTSNEKYSNESLPNHDFSEETIQNGETSEPSDKMKIYLQEIVELTDLGILNNLFPTPYAYSIPSWSKIKLHSTLITSIGISFCKILGLNEIEDQTLDKVYAELCDLKKAESI